MEIRIGDKVRVVAVTHDGVYACKELLNLVGDVVQMRGYDVLVSFENGTKNTWEYGRFHPFCRWIKFDELEIVEEEIPNFEDELMKLLE